MPCMDAGPRYSGEDYEARRSIKEMKKRLDLVTRLLCGLLTVNPDIQLTPEMHDWWAKHQEDDRKRR